jgi:hypothetical protein
MKNLVVVDIECYPNYFLIAFKDLSRKRLLTVECYGESCLSKEDKQLVRRVMTKNTTFGFNSIKYDMPMIVYALDGANCIQLNVLSKKIIENNQPEWMSYRNLDLVKPISFDHFDISEPSPAVMISLKNYGTRIGSKKLWDLPFDPSKSVSKDEATTLKEYCENDLDVTIDLYNAVKDRINLRVEMSEQYGLDLRSKSDAQIAETVITSELNKVGVDAIKPDLDNDYKAKYKAPDYISFIGSDLKDVLCLVQNVDFTLAANGSVKMPKDLSNLKIVIGSTFYKLGIGGLHSQEKALSIVSNNSHVMKNADFTSYYPFIILGLELYPKHLGKEFLRVYEKIVKTRLKAKAKGDTLVADSLKIVINGSFGKFGSKYSKLYSPNLLLATTITGQLVLLMLIEQLEHNGIRVVSANTDGLEYFCQRDKVTLAETIIFDNDMLTGFNMEHGEYKALHAANVNNYVAVYNGYVKSKGIFAETTLSKGRSTPIVYKAIREYLLNNNALEDTINKCKDINEFVSARTVKGGGIYDNEYLGKMVRWYYSKESKGYISYKLNGNKVPKTDGCKPMMNLSNSLPNDLDYEWYYNEAVEKLKTLGVDYE